MSRPVASGSGHSRLNNFDALRLFAVFLVIYGHGLDLTGGINHGFWEIPIARLGVDIFFSISGYLVTSSWNREPSTVPFIAKRALRIFPGLAMCVVLSAFVLGPLLTSLPLASYLSQRRTYTYLFNIAFYLRLYLPGLFTGLHDQGAVNGSLWSLFPEFACYLTVPVLARCGRTGRTWLLPILALFFGGVGVFLFESPREIVFTAYSLDLKYMLVEMPFFFVGGWLSLIEGSSRQFYRADLSLVALMANYVVSSHYGWWNLPLEWFSLPYVVVAFGRLSLPVLNRAGGAGDLSYGAYLYAFPIQQIVMWLYPHLAHPILACTVATLLTALLSWHLVEAPALRLKSRLGRLTPVADRVRHRTARAAVRLRHGLIVSATSPILPMVLAVLCIGVHAGLLDYGRWQTDEFRLLTNQRLWGWHILGPRLTYSPRPFSEGVLFLYASAILHLDRPLIVPFLAILWTGVLLAGALAARAALPRSPLRPAVALGLSGSLFAFVMVTSSVTELFYWPMAAIAYLPLIGAAMVLLFLLGDLEDGRRRLACGIALTIAATSCEMGAAFAIGFAAAACLELASRRGAGRRSAAGLLRECVWWLLPGIIGVLVIGDILSNRAQMVELNAGQQALTGRFAASAALALRRTLVDLIGGHDSQLVAGGPIGLLAAKLLFATGFALVWRQAAAGRARPGRWHAVLAAAIVVSSLFSVATAYVHYGQLCCERQSTTRFWLGDILLIIGAGVVLGRRRGIALPGWPAWIAPAVLAVSLFPALFEARNLHAAYVDGHLAAEAGVKTWRSGLGAGHGPMEFYLPPDGSALLIRGTSQPLGRYVVGKDAPDMVTAVGQFFGKTTIWVCQPWQTEKSWLISGQFIPACPPHDGPADLVYR